MTQKTSRTMSNLRFKILHICLTGKSCKNCPLKLGGEGSEKMYCIGTELAKTLGNNRCFERTNRNV